MTETNMKLEDWLDDLCVRFIINLPREELESVERICFQVEEAQWFYEDFIRPLDPALPSLSLKAFALRIFQHCPLMSQWSHYHHITAFSEFLAYKTRVPVRGAIMLNKDMDEVVLVKGWKKGANWSFPRGKINKDEKDLDCAIREVYEETGYDIRDAGLVKDDRHVKFIEITMREQHMRLYVFRDVPRDAHFEPRTRKEISKIEWYKLSELPTLKRSKQQDQGFAVANANKFYMVAPFMHPLKKWIAQQKKVDAKTQVGTKQILQNEGEVSMDETPGNANQAPVEMAAPNDLLEAASSQDASAHLKRLLNINNAIPKPAPIAQALPTANTDSSKSNALLELLRSGSSREQAPQEPVPVQSIPEAIPPPQAQPHLGPTYFPGFPQQDLPSGQPGHLPHIPSPPNGAPIHAFHPVNNHPVHQPFPPVMGRGMPSMPQPIPGQRLPSSFPSQPPPAQPIPKEGLLPFPPPSQSHAPAPYQQTGDPQFSQSAQPSQVQGAAVPPASKLPPPKLTSHSLALLNFFKDESSRTPKTASATLAPPVGKEQASGRRPSQQDQLLNLFKGSPSGAGPVELSAQSASPVQKQILQRPRGSPARAEPRAAHTNDAWTGATVSGPLDIPQPEMGRKPHPKKAQKEAYRKGNNNKDRQPQPPASPITILARPQASKKEPAMAQSSRNSSQSRTGKAKTQEAPKPFQPQILRRSGNPDNTLPLRSRETAVSDEQAQPGVPSPPPQAEHHHSGSFDRRPSQTASQRETLLSLFGKPSSSPGISPSGQLDLQTAVPKQSTTSSVVSPLSPLNLPSRTVSDKIPSIEEDSQASNTSNRVASPDNKAFLLGFLQGVAKGNK